MKKLTLLSVIIMVSYYFISRENSNETLDDLDEIEVTELNLKEDTSPSSKIKAKQLIEKEVNNSKTKQVKKTVLNIETNKVAKKSIHELFNKDTSFDSPEYYLAFLNAFKSGNHNEVKIYAKNLLTIPDKYIDQFWYGNLCHSVLIILARSYFNLGDIEQTEKYLLKSVNNTCLKKTFENEYSPQLSSFGPDRSLAFDLYKKGRRDSIVKYFELSKVFWESGVEEGYIKKAIKNINTTELTYEQEDDPHFPFPRVDYVVDLERAPMQSRTE